MTGKYYPLRIVDKLKIATINIPDEFLNCIEVLVNLGFYASRSSAIREALKQFLHHETVLNDNFLNFEVLKKKQMEKMGGFI